MNGKAGFFLIYFLRILRLPCGWGNFIGACLFLSLELESEVVAEEY